MIGEGKAAARLKGAECRTPEATHECPICFLYYSEINVTKCCHANICTECFLQVRPQREKHSSCPFCNHNKLNIDVAKQLTEQEILELQREEEEAEKARIRARQQGTPLQSSDKSESFGSSLERDSHVAMCRARSESFASSENSQEPMADALLIKSLAMTPEDRNRIEAEMRSQNLHPLTLQLEAEAEQRRVQNERNYHRSHSDHRGYRNSDSNPRSRRRNRPQGSRDWNQIVEAFESSGNGAINSLDDLVVLEAAILLSREEESRRNGGDDEAFDAARHAQDGFPLLRSFMSNRGQENDQQLQQHIDNLVRAHNANRRRSHLLRGGVGSRISRSMPETALDTAALLMGGISEEQQLAMAIAASLQDQNSTNNSNENSTGASNANEETSNEELIEENDDNSVVEPVGSHALPSSASLVGVAIGIEENHPIFQEAEAIEVDQGSDTPLVSTNENNDHNIDANEVVASNDPDDPEGEIPSQSSTSILDSVETQSAESIHPMNVDSKSLPALTSPSTENVGLENDASQMTNHATEE